MLVGSGGKCCDATYVDEIECWMDVYCACVDYGCVQCAGYSCGTTVGDEVETGKRGESPDEERTKTTGY
jgi:hypothetical protein